MPLQSVNSGSLNNGNYNNNIEMGRILTTSVLSSNKNGLIGEKGGTIIQQNDAKRNDSNDELYLSNDNNDEIVVSNKENNGNDIAKINVDGKIVEIDYKDLINILNVKGNNGNDTTAVIAGENIQME